MQNPQHPSRRYRTPILSAAPARPPQPGMSRRTRLLLIVAGSIVGAAVLALVAVNLLISADWVRDRVAQRIKEQTGRELTVNGTTALLVHARSAYRHDRRDLLRSRGARRHRGFFRGAAGDRSQPVGAD